MTDTFIFTEEADRLTAAYAKSFCKDGDGLWVRIVR